MATAKAERLLNLVIALVNAPRFRSAAWIRERVAGYADAPTEEAFFRTFERDKTELRDMGIPLQTSGEGADADGTVGYRIPPGEFALPPMGFTPAETAALGLASRLWETTALSSAGSGALRKIRDAVPADQEAAEAVDTAARSAAGLLQPRVRTSDPSFTPLFDAVKARRAVAFDYRKQPGEPAEARAVQPWGLVSFRGRWYLVGFDTGRGGQRTFRLSRIAGQVSTVGRAGAVRIPENVDLLATVARNVEAPVRRTATLLVRPGRAAGLRRDGNPLPDAPEGWDRVQVPVRHLWDTARMVAGHGPDVRVEEPPDLRDAVVRVLTDVAGRTAG
ncbi:helix-turn-helix transcriptional regulator [Nakamurella alba]|uniref:helix-turn-helix transcriptional regulator n=1 Tax=Nakamurella alba TaxID=2665158 RepID=UPI002AC35200|nr:WYL domain-containing protein [Nakamurella alba]